MALVGVAIGNVSKTPVVTAVGVNWQTGRIDGEEVEMALLALVCLNPMTHKEETYHFNLAAPTMTEFVRGKLRSPRDPRPLFVCEACGAVWHEQESVSGERCALCAHITVEDTGQ